MAVDVTFTMASRWFRICGSGTSRTSMRRIPIQQFALISTSKFRLGAPPGLSVQGPLLLALVVLALVLSLLLAPLLGLRRRDAGLNARIRADDLADLHDLLETAQIV